jgi:hypothetical protein
LSNGLKLKAVKKYLIDASPLFDDLPKMNVYNRFPLGNAFPKNGWYRFNASCRKQ